MSFDDITTQHRQHREDLLRNVDYAVAQRGCPGAAVPYLPTSFAIFTNADPNAPFPVASAGTYGAGRVVVLSHEAYLEPQWELHAHAPFIHSCIAWVAGGKSVTSPVVSRQMLSAVPSTHVLLWTGGGGSDASSVEEIRSFVYQGGGLIVARCPWGYISTHPN
eukprot:PhF_6_TR11551/c0_g1_i4/m.18564